MVKFIHEPRIILSRSNPSFSSEFLERVTNAYRFSSSGFGGSLDSMWEGFAAKKKDIHDALTNDDLVETRRLLENPALNYLFYGFDILYPESTKRCIRQSAVERIASEKSLAFDVIKLAEAIGVRRVFDPKKQTEYAPAAEVDVDDLFAAIAASNGITLHFPTPFAHEYGLATRYGIASYRSINAIYQAFLVMQLSRSFCGEITEIGGGSGRTAYFAHLMGSARYRIIDVPLTNVAQAIFLGAALGESSVRLAGERDIGQPIAILPPSELAGGPEGVVLNVDSLPEMAMEHIDGYLAYVCTNAKAFLSINHEAHEALVGSKIAARARLYRRNQYWLRAGYVEEFFEF